jgi:hypothetical protein
MGFGSLVTHWKNCSGVVYLPEPIGNSRVPKVLPVALPVSTALALNSANSICASAIPTSTAFLISGDNFVASSAPSAPMPSLANRSRSFSSDG